MEDIIEAVFSVFIVVCCALVAGSKKKKKKNAAQKTVEKPTAAARRQAVEKVRSAVVDARAVVEAMIDELPEEAKEVISAVEAEEHRSAPRRAKSLHLSAKSAERPASGESIVDEHGCIGGSLGEHSAEGEDPHEHAQHLKEAERRRQAVAIQSAQASNMRAKARAEMRRAVVWSEILDRPKALRG